MSTEDPRLSLLQALCDVAEAQVEAARVLDHARLGALNITYSDLIFELNIILQEPAPPDPAFRERVRQLRARLAAAHTRLGRLAGSMISLVGRVMPTTPPGIYTRNGRLA